MEFDGKYSVRMQGKSYWPMRLQNGLWVVDFGNARGEETFSNFGVISKME